MKEKKRVFLNCDKDINSDIFSSFGISPIIVRLLCNRGVDTFEKVNEFVTHKLSSLHNPMLLADMDKACDRITAAVNRGEKVVVYGDYDVDGVTSTALLVTYLRSIGLQTDYYIPDRYEEGYGINVAALDKIKEDGATLIITVDSGVTAVEEIEHAKMIGLDVVICDHHECSDKLPDAIAVVNPKRHDCQYPFKELAGVGVVFKIICALEGPEKTPQLIDEYIDMVAIGTIADVMPLIGENRIIVHYGLEKLEKTDRPGIKALFSCSGVNPEKKITSGVIGYTIAPRINAAGRIGCAKRAAELFLTKDTQDANLIACDLCDENRRRQATENEIMEQALNMLKERGFSTDKEKIIVLWKDGWHHGVIGIVASRISDIYNCPVILISFDGEKGKGSGRSIRGFNLFAALEDSSEYLCKFGGHELAAGLSICKDNIDIFCERIGKYAMNNLSSENMVRVIEIDCSLDLEDVDLPLIKSMELLEPYGVGNPMPQFIIYGLCIADIIAISNDKHLRLLLKKGDCSINAFLFGMPPDIFELSKGDIVDVVCTLDINSYRGTQTPQIIIKDISLCDDECSQIEYYTNIYNSFSSGKLLAGTDAKEALPDRDSFVAVYRYLKQNSFNNRFSCMYLSLNRSIAWYSKTSLNFCRLMICLDVLNEFGLVNYEIENKKILIEIIDIDGKINLNNSKILNRLKSMMDRG